MTFLYKVSHRETEVAELACHGDYEPHMRLGNAVECFDVLFLLPPYGKEMFFFALQIWSCHSSFYKPASAFLHDVLLLTQARQSPPWGMSFNIVTCRRFHAGAPARLRGTLNKKPGTRPGFAEWESRQD